MNRNNKLIIYTLCALLIAIATIYFITAYGEYSDLVELLDYGIQGETQEKLVEITLFIGSGIIYLGLFIWILKSGLRYRLPYLLSIVVSITLVIIYIASRTIGVPIVGVELYVGKLDIASKILQVIVMGLAGFTALSVTRLQLVKNIK